MPEQPPADSTASAATRVTGEAPDGGTAAKQSMTTVRKAAVVMNPFGPSMLDSGAKSGRQLRFVITPSRAVHVLDPYASALHATVTAGAGVAIDQPQRASGSDGVRDAQSAGEREEQEEGEEDLFGEALQDQDWLAIDHLVQSQLTPS